MIKFYLPNFYGHPFETLNFYIANQLKEHPEYFYDNISIGAIYGTFPGVIWNAGRVIYGDFEIQRVKEIIDKFNNLGISIRFTYTNLAIDSQEQLENPIANFVTEIAHNGKNEIIVSNDYLEAYLREKFPNYKYISSTTKCLLDNEEIIRESEKYYMTVIDYRKNRDLDFLKSLKNPDKYEILINAWCSPKCPNRRKHYEQMSLDQINNEPSFFKLNQFNCSVPKMNFFDSFKRETVLKVEELYDIYVPLGFENFKIEGRTYSILDVLETYLYYMVKPECKDKMRLNALKNIEIGNNFK